MVGTTGFEPATSPTPRVRSTRLSHVPTLAELREGLPKCTRRQGYPTSAPPRGGDGLAEVVRQSPGKAKARPVPSPRSWLCGRRYVFLGLLATRTEEKLIHLFDEEALSFLGPGLQTVFVQQHLLVIHPLAPRLFGDVVVNLLAKIVIEGQLVEALHLLLILRA